MSGQKIIVTVAVTGGVGDKSRHPELPASPKEIADSALEAHAAGAVVAHIHVRDPETGEPSMALEYYREVTERIRDASDMIVNLTTGAGGRIIPDDGETVGLGTGTIWCSPEKRTEHIIAIRPELCSLDVGSMNFGDFVFANTFPHVEKMARIIKEAGVKPELEVFDLGHIRIGRALIEKGVIEGTPLFQLCLGIPWGIPSGMKSMLLMRDALPPDAIWGGFSIGPENFPMAAQVALLGGNVRVGFEDNFYLAKGNPAKTNAELVQKAIRILNALDKEPASPTEARKILGLTKR